MFAEGDNMFRIGQSIDIHQLVEGRDLYIGGVKIDHDKGLLGHSDADVLLHAIIESIIGALGLGDIGKHFPDNDDSYKGISSMFLLEKVAGILEDNMYVVGNIDATIIAQQPKMRPHIEKMEENIAGALGIDVNQVNIKATTEEGLGFTGSGEGISAQAICMIQSVYEGAVTVADSEGTGRCQSCAGCSRA